MTTRYYVRVSTMEQKIDRQILAYDGADEVYIDKMSGATKNRPQLQKLLADLQENDVVVVKSLDRLSRSTKDLLEISEQINAAGAGLKILNLGIDTSTVSGKAVMTILGAIAEMERATIKERTAEGIAIAKEKGKYKGRQKGAIALNGESLKRFKRFYNKGFSMADLAREFNVSRPTIYKWVEVLKERKEIE